MSAYNDFIKKVKDEATAYAIALGDAYASAEEIDAHALALALLDVSDLQGWDRLTWTGDSDEYNASYGHDEDGNEIDPVPPQNALDFARDLLKDYVIVRRPR